jgi:hypothetical protein
MQTGAFAAGVRGPGATGLAWAAPQARAARRRKKMREHPARRLQLRRRWNCIQRGHS